MDVKLRYIDKENQARREIASYYLKHIINERIILPLIKNGKSVEDNLSHVWHLFVLRTENRDLLNKYYFDNEIQTLIHYPIPPHKQRAYSQYNNKKYEITELIHNQVLSIPISPVQSACEIEKIIDLLNKYVD